MSELLLKDPNSEQVDNLVNSWTLVFKNEEYEMECNDNNTRVVKLSKLDGEAIEFHFALLERKYADAAALRAAVLAVWADKATLVYDVYPVVLTQLKETLNLD